MPRPQNTSAWFTPGALIRAVTRTVTRLRGHMGTTREWLSRLAGTDFVTRTVAKQPYMSLHHIVTLCRGWDLNPDGT